MLYLVCNITYWKLFWYSFSYISPCNVKYLEYTHTVCSSLLSGECDSHCFICCANLLYYQLRRATLNHSVGGWVELNGYSWREEGQWRGWGERKDLCHKCVWIKLPSSSLIRAVASGWKISTPLSVVVSSAANSSSTSYTLSLMMVTDTLCRVSPGWKVSSCVVSM